MIPEKGKTYKIDYWFQTIEPEDKELFYKGLATFTGETDIGQNDETLYIFQCPDNAFTSMFGEEDIIEEVDNTKV